MNREDVPAALRQHLEKDHGYEPTGKTDPIYDRPYDVHRKVAPKCDWVDMALNEVQKGER